MSLTFLHSSISETDTGAWRKGLSLSYIQGTQKIQVTSQFT